MMILLIAGIIALVAILLMGLLFVFWIWPMIRRSQAKSSGEAAEAVIQSAQNPSRGINSDENRE